MPLATASPESIYLNGQLSSYRESIEITDLTNNAPPHLASQYLRVFVGRLSAQNTPLAELLAGTKELLSNLTSGAITPLHHVCANMVATSLVELADRVETQVEAHAAIKEMSDALSNGQILHRSLDHHGWDAAVRELLHQSQDPTPPTNTYPEQTNAAPESSMAGLQHLAAAAVGEREVTETRPVSNGGDNGSHERSLANTEHDLSAAMAAANDAAMAQATAAAAQQQLTVSSPDAKNGNNFESSASKQDEFMASLS